MASLPVGGCSSSSEGSGVAEDSGTDASTDAADASNPPFDAGAGDGSSSSDAPPPDAGGPVIVPFACPSGATAAVFVKENAPPATMAPWVTAAVTVTFANCSTSTWNATDPSAPNGYKLGFAAPRDSDVWGAGRVKLPADVPPSNAV